ncbi:hypothetical protein FSP39_009109 [Pinctada imbricata]|uniref:Reverse transcriptase domain-containing protein n=1 Tax=Pinctada imbricata TaxID=66713 RepID=A0AA88XLL6_PINIB|nr:hypothetical protein FSP39_009109 [Pinctada imbricata]
MHGDHIATLCIIIEQSMEWNSPLYINFIDYEKAFDSVDRETLWTLLRHYGVPKKIVNLIKNSYEGMSCRVIHEGQLTESFQRPGELLHRIQTFINKCLRRILSFRWPQTIRNTDLWQQTNQRSIEEEIMRRRWGWLGHTLKKPVTNITRQPLMWNPQGKRRRGRPRHTWHRDLDADVKLTGPGKHGNIWR